MWGALVKYIRTNLLGIAIGCAVTCFVLEVVLFSSKDLYFTKVAAMLVFVTAGYEKQRDLRFKQQKLKKKGLTLGDIQNIEFVKNWEMLRQRGIYKYCFLEGGLMIGLIILLPLSLIGMMVASNLRTLFSDINKMLWYITYCGIVGYVLGTTIYFIRWVRNEKRFIRLTDPLA